MSGLGKGVTASSIGVVLKGCGLRCTSIKIGKGRGIRSLGGLEPHPGMSNLSGLTATQQSKSPKLLGGSGWQDSWSARPNGT